MFIVIIGDKAYGPYEGAYKCYNSVFKYLAKNKNDPQDILAFKKARLDEAKRFKLPSGAQVAIYPLES